MNTDKEPTSKYNSSTGTWSCHYLEALSEYMLMTGITVPQIARRMGRSRQTISKYLRNDFVDLATYMEIFAKFGCKITFEYRKPDEKKNSKIQILIPENKTIGKGSLRRLGFLATAMKKYGISTAMIAEKLNVQTQTVQYWMRPAIDNIGIPYLFQIADAFNLELINTVTCIEEEESDNNTDTQEN